MNEHDMFRDMAGARNDLRPEEAAQLDAHIVDCAECRRLAQEYGRQDMFLQALRLPEPAVHLRHDVFRRITEGPVRRRAVWRWAAYLGPASVAVIVLAVALLQSHSSHPAASQARQPAKLLMGTQTNSAAFGPAQVSTQQVPAAPLNRGPNADSARPAGTSVVFIGVWTGSARSRWLRLSTGTYGVESRNHPLGCLHSAALVGTNGYHVVALHPNFAPHVSTFKGGRTWAGYTANLVAGTYRLVGVASLSCRWSARITR